MANILKKDTIVVGVVIGIIVPAILYGILYLLSVICAPQGKELLLPIDTMLLVAIFPNLFIIRHYLVKLQLDKIGRGILISTFVLAMVYFVYYLKLNT
ncbi:MAG: hypothetical protein IKS33_01730 [Bacteroidales bacterium]|nr:hypothetical protein [Bacteroidales bacterium]